MSNTEIVHRTRKHGKHRQAVMHLHQGICHLCGKPYADTIDHIVPVAHGGSDDVSNLKPAHTSCNSRKRDAKPPAWTYDKPDMWLPGFGPRSHEATLDGIDHGTYGMCEVCAKPIGKLRLQALPRATMCLACKEIEEIEERRAAAAALRGGSE